MCQSDEATRWMLPVSTQQRANKEETILSLMEGGISKHQTNSWRK